MRKTFPQTLLQPALAATMLLLSACSAATTVPAPAAPTGAGITATATATSIPATKTAPATGTPEPPAATATATATLTPSETFLPADTATPTLAPPTPSGEDAINIYYSKVDPEDSKKGEKKKHSTASCDTTVVAINTGLPRSGDVEADVATGLSRLFSKVKGFGELANPAYLSNIEVQSVDFNPTLGLVDVRLAGTYVRSGDRCDDRRVREQVWTTIRQFKGIKTVYILLNGNLLGDILATGQ